MTTGGSEAASVFVEAPSRLHFGMLDMRGSHGRRYGGIGAAVPTPSLLIEATAAEHVEGTGPDAERACEFARRFLDARKLAGGVRIRVHRAIPAHAGLGSGTQLALAVARSLAELYDLPGDVARLTTDVGRALRSAIGTWTFAHGGFIVEGGRQEASAEPAPLLARLSMPDEWRCVIAVPSTGPAVSGASEAAAFEQLPLPPQAEVERVAHLVLMRILPSLADGDLAGFGEALSEVQRINGRWFAPVQGGIFTPGVTGEIVARMREWGAAGVGQSSWGPTAYGIVASEQASSALAARVRALLGDGGVVYESGFADTGARVWR